MTNDSKDWKKFKEEALEKELQTDEATLDERDDSEEDTHEDLENEEGSKNSLNHPSYQELEEKLTLAEQKAHENWEKSVRAVAELENVRRRAERDVNNAYRYGLEKFIQALLPVVDSLEQALDLANKSEDLPMKEGLELTLKLFMDALNREQVQQIDPKGQPFNPAEHEAMSIQPTDEVPADSIAVVFQRGYKLNDRVIRPARVIVAKSLTDE